MAPDPLLPGAEPARIPRATYRLQFHAGFTFRDAEALVPYLHTLGISHLYASSYLAAQPGSRHGYDIVNHNALNPELGTEADYEAMVAALAGHGMSHLLDVVPNHMGIGHGSNPWWNDLLEHGPGSQYAEFFDVDWDPVKRQLRNRVLLPILGDQYGRELEAQKLRLDLHDGSFRLWVYDAPLPLTPKSVGELLRHRLDALLAILPETDADLLEYQSILTALANLPGLTETAPDRVRMRARESEVIRRRLAALAERSEVIRGSLQETLGVYNGKAGDPRSFDLLDRLLDQQPYRLAYWRVAAEEINYRRFFDINDLAAIRMENPAVFREAHRLVLRLIEEGKIGGLRLDHPDGLFDPPGYFLALQRERAAQLLRVHLRLGPLSEPERAAAFARGAAQFETACRKQPGSACRPLYLLAEKILAQGERLPVAWCIHGTTGYEFLNWLGGLFVDPAGEKALTGAYTIFTGNRTAFPDLVYECKKLILQVSMSSELSVLGHNLSRLAERNRYSRDFTLSSLTSALREVIACFPVYRTYIGRTGAEVGLQDRACVEVAVAFAKRRNPTTNVSIYDFVRDTLLLRSPENVDAAYLEEQQRFVGKFQQVTSPVEAKGVEDTAFYRYNRLVALNEVGGRPDRFGTPLEEFHAHCLRRLERWPGGLSATSTHDTKRSEDVRARIAALSELPHEWRTAVGRWHRWNRRHLIEVDGRPAPDRDDEYLLYQTLVGSWPLDLPEAGPPSSEYAARIQAYMLKAAKEAKRNTSWINPNQAYDEALQRFVAAVLAPSPGNRFLSDFRAFHPRLARLGMVNSLAQTLIKIAAPGVPDFYQGTELWDFSLVDPDNRRPVDFPRRARLLAELTSQAASGDLLALARELLAAWPDGRIKLYLTHQALTLRREHPELFQEGRYLPLAVAGAGAPSLCAFARERAGTTALVVAPRLTAGRTEGGLRPALGEPAWADTVVVLPPELPRRYQDRLTGRRLETRDWPDGEALVAAEILADFPVALLVAEPEPPGGA